MKLGVQQTTVVCVTARERWNDTGIEVLRGEEYSLQADGTWSDASIEKNADGYSSSNSLFQVTEGFRRIPSAAWFALIGTVGRDLRDAACIGVSGRLQATRDGNLFCFANDLPFMYWNNSGSIRVTVTRIR